MQVVNSCCLILIMAWCGRLVFVVCLSQPAAQPPHTHPSNPQPSQPCGEGSYESVHEASGWHNMSCAHAPPRYTRPRMNGEKCTSVGELSHQRDRAKAGVRDAIRAGGAPLPPHAVPADAPPPPNPIYRSLPLLLPLPVHCLCLGLLLPTTLESSGPGEYSFSEPLEGPVPQEPFDHK